MHHVKLVKTLTINQSSADASPTGSIDDGYTILGHIHEYPKVGHRFSVLRYKRNEALVSGIFETSEVTSIFIDKIGWIIKTLNSEYSLTILDIGPSIRNNPVFRPNMSREVYMEDVKSMILRNTDFLASNNILFNSDLDENKFFDSLSLFLEETFHWPDFRSYN